MRSVCYPGFECCISDVLWDGGGSLKELAMFYRFKKEIYPENSVQVVAENSSVYGGYQERQYSAEAFYEWMNTRKNKLQYTSLVELLVGYQGHVIPVIIAVWLMCQIEKRLHKVVPAMFDLFVTPLVSVFVTGYLTLAAIGPVFTKLENGIITGVQTLITLPYGIGSFIMGGLYAVTVVAGIHHMYTLIDLGQLARYGYTYWLPLASAANVAQGGAALAVALKSKDTKVKSMALPSALSACMGITEPAIFGVNLRYFKPFLGGLLGGACGAWYASIVGLGATGTGVTGIFGILLHLHMPLQYIIMMAISFGVSFAVTWVIWSPEEVKA